MTVYGGQYYGWTEGFANGFGSYAIAQILMGVAYFCLIGCMAETASAVPLKGGAFGVTRVCSGFYLGFVIGAIELLEYLVYTSAAVAFLAEHMAPYLGESIYYKLVIKVGFYVVSTFFLLAGGRTLWNFVTFQAVIYFVFMWIFILGMFQYCDFNKNAPYVPHITFTNTTTNQTITVHEHVENKWFIGGMSSYIASFPLTTAAFGGVEGLATMPAMMKNPKDDLAFSLMASMALLFVTNFILVFVMASLPPGIFETSEAEFPMNWGFNKLFNINDSISSTFTLPAQFGMAFGFMPSSARLVLSFGRANLMPKWTGLNTTKTMTSSIIIISVLSLLINIVAFFYPALEENLLDIAVLAGFTTYFSQIIGFLMFKGRFSTIERDFVSPFGKIGAYFAIVYFALGFISGVAFQNDGGLCFYSIVLFVFFISVYYYFGPKDIQTISDEEFRMNVINSNYRKAHHKKGWFSKLFLGNKSEKKTVSRRPSVELHSMKEKVAKIANAFVPIHIGEKTITKMNQILPSSGNDDASNI